MINKKRKREVFEEQAKKAQDFGEIKDKREFMSACVSYVTNKLNEKEIKAK